MAVFEKKIARKVYLDDTQILTCTFENAQNIQGHTEYIIRVQRGPLPEKFWLISKRYSDFLALHNVLQNSGLILSLPPKKLIGNMDREFVAERQSGLQKYLNFVLMNPILASSLPVKKFLDPDNYSTPFQEIALQHVSMALRSEANYEVVKPVPEIGWRLRKHFFLVKGRNMPKDELLLSWAEYGPDKYLEDKDMLNVFKSIATIKHPYIQTAEFSNCNEIGGFMVHSLCNVGSLRDIICCAKPKMPFIKKYANPKQVKPLQVTEIEIIGRQILEALKFLHEKGLPYGHLHTGNILFENNHVKLLEVENGVLGLPSYYRPYFVQHKKIQSLESIDVYCFGHVLYEMAFGQPLHESICDTFPPSCSPLLKSVFESILSSEACKGGLPTVGGLLTHPFFNSSRTPLNHESNSERPHLKFSSHTKEVLKFACQKMEERLKEEQKQVRHQKRLVKMQELLSSEGEKKRNHKPKTPNQLSRNQQLITNGKSPERSESPNSTSTANSAGTVTPPSGVLTTSPTPPVPPSVPPVVQHSNLLSNAGNDRLALLGCIQAFNKSSLKKTSTNITENKLGRVID